MTDETDITVSIRLRGSSAGAEKLQEQLDKFNANPQEYSVLVTGNGDHISIEIAPKEAK